MSAEDATPAPTGEAPEPDLREEIAAARTAQAKNHRATMSTLGRLQATMAAANSPSLKPRAAKNTQVRSKKFFAPLYAGAQDEDGFQESWAALLTTCAGTRRFASLKPSSTRSTTRARSPSQPARRSWTR